MLFYNVGALIKIGIGITILSYLFNYVNPYHDQIIGISFGFLGIFLITWGASFYIFYIAQKIFSKKSNISIASRSYRVSLLFGLFILLNGSLIILDKWTKPLGIIILIVFIILQLLTIGENE